VRGLAGVGHIELYVVDALKIEWIGVHTEAPFAVPMVDDAVATALRIAEV
jgi:hypothetical protein